LLPWPTSPVWPYPLLLGLLLLRLSLLLRPLLPLCWGCCRHLQSWKLPYLCCRCCGFSERHKLLLEAYG
jgi:hypothetical protein